MSKLPKLDFEVWIIPPDGFFVGATDDRVCVTLSGVSDVAWLSELADVLTREINLWVAAKRREGWKKRLLNSTRFNMYSDSVRLPTVEEWEAALEAWIEELRACRDY